MTLAIDLIFIDELLKISSDGMLIGVLAKALLATVDKWAKANSVSRSDALRQLTERGLGQSEPKKGRS